MRLAIVAALLAPAWVPLAATAKNGARLPYALAIRVGYAEDRGPATLADDVAFALVAEMGARGCFRAVALAPADGLPAADLVLDVTLSAVREEVRYEQSVAERAQPLDPSAVALGAVATLSFHEVLRLAAVPGGAVAREAKFGVSAARRPAMPGEDPREGARADAVLDAARRARAEVCRGAARKLRGAVEAARAAPR